jgi:nucleotide-binding universal stress UspA family protein
MTFQMVHVGETEFPAVITPDKPGWTWERRMRAGEAVTALDEAITEFDPDLLVMTTAGHHGFMDAVRGSTTERVLRAAPCPLLAVSVSARLSRLVWR